MEEYGHIVFVKLWSEELLSARARILDRPAANDEIAMALGDTFVVDGKGSDKDGHLKQKVNYDTKACDETEVLQRRYIS